MEYSLGLTICKGTETRLNKFKSIESISSILSDHNSIKLDISHRKRNEKNMTTRTISNMLQNN